MVSRVQWGKISKGQLLNWLSARHVSGNHFSGPVGVEIAVKNSSSPWQLDVEERFGVAESQAPNFREAGINVLAFESLSQGLHDLNSASGLSA
jgi:hypothetical protein